MPFKHNAARRHRISKRRWRVTNCLSYEVSLRRRGDLIIWLDDAALSGWNAPRRTTRGGKPLYTDLAIELVLTLRLVFSSGIAPGRGLCSLCPAPTWPGSVGTGSHHA